MLQTHRLTKRFGKFIAVDNLSLDIHAGEIYGFLGPNGAGKTTTLKLILGLIQPTAGDIRIFNQRMTNAPLAIRRRLGVVLEMHSFYEEMSAWEYLLFFGRLYEVEQTEKRAKALLERLNLWRFRNVLVGGFSTGMQRKLAFARALLHDPELLLLDEPVSGLDPFGIVQIREILKDEHSKGKTILISSHILSEVEKLANRVGIIARGRLIAESKMQQISRLTQSGLQVAIDLLEMPEGLIANLETLPFVRSVTKYEGTRLIVDVELRDEHRSNLARALYDMGAVVQGMQVLESSLEEAFITLTEAYIEQLASTTHKELPGHPPARPQ